MKKQMIAAVFMASFAVPAFADNFEAQVFDTQPEKMKVAELSQQEMKETEGAFLGGFTSGQMMAINATTNVGSYYLFSDNPSLQGAVVSAGLGAITGGAGQTVRLMGHNGNAMAINLVGFLANAMNTHMNAIDNAANY